VDFALSDEQTMLQDAARRFLGDKVPGSAVRTVMETERGYDPSLWEEIARHGWQAVAIPESYGGAGFSFLEQAILMEEMGRTLFPSPYLSSVILAANLILHAGTEEQKAALLPGVASGEDRLAVAHLERGGRWDPSGIEMTGRREGGDLILDGTKSYVLDWHTADTLLVVVRTEPGSGGDAGISIVVVPADAPGVARRRLETLDMTRKQAEVVFDGVRVPIASILGAPGRGWGPVAATLTRAVVALAYEEVGGARRCLDMAVEYAKSRVQFGRPIGSFQAIKHKCADMLVKVESARSAAYYAGWAATHDEAELAIAAPLAKAYCSEAFFFCAAENIQVHGGIGFTWEHDAHLYFRRAKTDELLFGTPAEHRRVLAERLGI
jgi:alkylation response protein AidB-like acyl-CoA dehydrogenase